MLKESLYRGFKLKGRQFSTYLYAGAHGSKALKLHKWLNGVKAWLGS